MSVDSGFHVCGFRIPRCGFRIPCLWIQDSTSMEYGFHRPKLPGFRIPDYLTWGEKSVLTILEWIWNQRFRDKKTKLNFVITCLRRPHNCKTGHSRRGKNEKVCEMYRNENFTCKACKSIVFHRQVCKFFIFLFPWSSPDDKYALPAWLLIFSFHAKNKSCEIKKRVSVASLLWTHIKLSFLCVGLFNLFFSKLKG